jgi:light-regulated signal transduction histidine kinase (bacteriophytochrome)
MAEPWHTITSFSPIINTDGNITGAACLSRDVTETFKHMNAIEKQNEKLREIAWIQSHVVRAPLARMMGIVHLIGELQIASPECETLLKYLMDSGRELDVIIHDIVNKSNQIDVKRLNA